MFSQIIPTAIVLVLFNAPPSATAATMREKADAVVSEKLLELNVFFSIYNQTVIGTKLYCYHIGRFSISMERSYSSLDAALKTPGSSMDKIAEIIIDTRAEIFELEKLCGWDTRIKESHPIIEDTPLMPSMVQNRVGRIADLLRRLQSLLRRP